MSRRKRSTYLGVMLCVGIALIVDRCFLSNGTVEPAVAEAVEKTPSAATISMSPSDVAPTLSMPELPFPRAVAVYNARLPIRDLFAPPEAVLNRNLHGTATDKNHPGFNPIEQRGRMGHATFVTLHRLNGVIAQERLKIAIVDEAWLRIGQSVDGCTLTAVSGDEVRFACHDGEAMLKVNDAGTLTRD